MPMFRIPATGECFVLTTTFVDSPEFAASGVAPESAPEAQHVAVRPRWRHASRRAAVGQPRHTLRLEEFLDSTIQHTTVTRVSAAASPAFAVALQRRLRRKGTGENRVIAFYTLGDPVMSPLWRDYADAFVRGTAGFVFGAQTQADAAAQLEKVRDADVREVYFVGHGIAPSAASGKLKQPAFMLSGTEHNGHFSAGRYSQLVTPNPGPLVRALAPLLSLEHQVIVRFLACNCGAGKTLQLGFAQAVSKFAPGIDVRVEGYSGKYMVKKDHSNNAHVEDERHAKSADYLRPRTLPIDYQPRSVPPSSLVVELKLGVEITPTYEDAFADLDFDSDDPIEGLET